MFMAMEKSVPNVILISMQILYSLTLIDILKQDKTSLILLHVWLGHLFYNYQVFIQHFIIYHIKKQISFFK